MKPNHGGHHLRSIFLLFLLEKPTNHFWEVISNPDLLSFENEADRIGHTGYYLPTVEIKDYNVMIDGRNFFDQSVTNNIKTYETIRKFAMGQEDDYITNCLLDYLYFKENNKMIAIDLSKQQALDADPKAKHQINFTGSLDSAGNTTMAFILEEAK